MIEKIKDVVALFIVTFVAVLVVMFIVLVFIYTAITTPVALWASLFIFGMWALYRLLEWAWDRVDVWLSSHES